jgi:hypothetical protein
MHLRLAAVRIMPMDNDIEQIFKSAFRPVDPPGYLLAAVGDRLVRAKLLRARWRSSLFAILSVIAAYGMVSAGGNLLVESAYNGFAQYWALMFSDAGLLFAHWADFLQTLAETLPVWPLSILFGSAVALLYSIKYLFEDLPDLTADHKIKI